MLVIYPTSACDICLDAYTLSVLPKSPHVIECGHIFCYECLCNMDPSTCPMCRKAFNPNRIRKLRVDKAPSSGDGAATSSSSSSRICESMAEADEYMRRAGYLFAEDAEDDDVDKLVEEVTCWLTLNAGPSSQPLQHAINALHQRKALQRQHDDDAETIEKLRAILEWHDDTHEKKQKDPQLDLVVENMLDEQEKITEEYEIKLAAAEAEATSLRGQSLQLVESIQNYLCDHDPETLWKLLRELED